jgi:hypothetical protein
MKGQYYLVEKFEGAQGDPATPIVTHSILNTEELITVLNRAGLNGDRIAVYQFGKCLLDWTFAKGPQNEKSHYMSYHEWQDITTALGMIARLSASASRDPDEIIRMITNSDEKHWRIIARKASKLLSDMSRERILNE